MPKPMLSIGQETAGKTRIFFSLSDDIRTDGPHAMIDGGSGFSPLSQPQCLFLDLFPSPFSVRVNTNTRTWNSKTFPSTGTSGAGIARPVTDLSFVSILITTSSVNVRLTLKMVCS